MINEFYAKEAQTPEEARILAMMYLRTISSAFVDISASVYDIARENGFRGNDNSNPDNQLMTRKLIEQYKLSGISIGVTEGPFYTLEAKRVHPICYNYRSDSSSSYTFGLTSFVNNIFEKQLTLKDKSGAIALEETAEKLREMAETMRKYFIIKPHYLWSVDQMCSHLLDTYFLLNVPSPLIAIYGSDTARFATGDVDYIGTYKSSPDQKYNKLPRMGIDFYIDKEFYHKMNLVDASKIDKDMPITGDQTKNIPMWNALRALGQKWITDERLEAIKILATDTLKDSALSKNFNKII